MTRQIPLTRGLFATVDDEDYERLVVFRWYTNRDVDGRNYACRNAPMINGVRGKTLYMHRQILAATPGAVVDHMSGDTLNNTRANIRLCAPRENQRNITSSKKQKLGGFKGVSWEKRRGYWYADIKAGQRLPSGRRRSIYLGKCPSAEIAARRYDVAAIEHFGDFAATNFPRADYANIEAVKAAIGASK